MVTFQAGEGSKIGQRVDVDLFRFRIDIVREFAHSFCHGGGLWLLSLIVAARGQGPGQKAASACTGVVPGPTAIR
jgi:hypothetical protein